MASSIKLLILPVKAEGLFTRAENYLHIHTSQYKSSTQVYGQQWSTKSKHIIKLLICSHICVYSICLLIQWYSTKPAFDQQSQEVPTLPNWTTEAISTPTEVTEVNYDAYIFSTDGMVSLQQQLLTWNCCGCCAVMRILLIIAIAFLHSDQQTMSKLIPIPAAPNPMAVSGAFRLQIELAPIPLNKHKNMRSSLSSTDHGHSRSAINSLVTKGHCWNLLLSTSDL